MKKQTKRIWHLFCVKWIGWRKTGARAIKARPEGGKYLNAAELPEHVKSAFDLTDDRLYIKSFTSEEAIKTYIENGATVKPYKIGWLITFEVTDYRKKKNPKAREYAKNAPRNKYGRFESARAAIAKAEGN